MGDVAAQRVQEPQGGVDGVVLERPDVGGVGQHALGDSARRPDQDRTALVRSTRAQEQPLVGGEQVAGPLAEPRVAGHRRGPARGLDDEPVRGHGQDPVDVVVPSPGPPCQVLRPRAGGGDDGSGALRPACRARWWPTPRAPRRRAGRPGTCPRPRGPRPRRAPGPPPRGGGRRGTTRRRVGSPGRARGTPTRTRSRTGSAPPAGPPRRTAHRAGRARCRAGSPRGVRRPPGDGGRRRHRRRREPSPPRPRPAPLRGRSASVGPRRRGRSRRGARAPAGRSHR